MRLAEFIVDNVEPILAEWEAFARTLSHGSQLPRHALRDHLELILRATAQEMQQPQSRDEQARKAKGEGGAHSVASVRLDKASGLHGQERVVLGFDIVELVAEYRAMRASVIRLWQQQSSPTEAMDTEDTNRFHESIDQSIASAVGSYSEQVDASRKMFLAMLSHDLREPVLGIRMAAEMIGKGQEPGEMLSYIQGSTQTINDLIRDLIDFASTGLGGTMQMYPGPVDLEALCREVVASYRVAHPQRRVEVGVEGRVHGVWDADRIRQVVSNLVANAFEHGVAGGPVTLTVAAEGPDPEGGWVVLRVHNEGEPIPEALMPSLFDPLTRFARAANSDGQRPSGIGLGLYIVREIVKANGGEVEVSSTREAGTTFEVRMPRKPAADQAG